MQSTAAIRPFTIASLLNIRRITVCWMVGGMVLTWGGCVSQQTYESARQEAKTRANELAQVQADIQSLEQQRDAAHAANQRDERTLGNLKSELQNIRASFDQIKKSNQAKLAALQHSIAALRTRHQTMLKEISETKRYEKKLEALTAQREQTMATMPAGPEAHVTTVDSLQQESRMVAVITPQSLKSEEPSASASPTPAPSPRDLPAAKDLSPPTATPQATSAKDSGPSPGKRSREERTSVRHLRVTHHQHSTGTAERILVFEYDGMVDLDVRLALVLKRMRRTVNRSKTSSLIILIGGSKAWDQALVPPGLLTFFLTFLTI